MPKLVKRSTKYAVEYYDPQKGFTTRESLGTDDLGTARRLFAEWQLAKALPERSTLEAVTIQGLLATFYAQAAKDYASKAVYKSALEYVVKYLPDLPLSEFKRARQEGFVARLRQDGLADGTIKRLMAAISTSVKRAYEYDVIPSKPHILSITDDARRDRVMTDDEARALIRASKSENAIRYMALALMTGARPSALIGLTKAQFDFDHHLLRLLPPGERQVKQKPKPTIPLPKSLEEMARTWQDGPVFVVHSDHGKGGQLKSNESIWLKISRAVPEDVTPYVIRHTVASELRKQGVPMGDIAGYLGHKVQGMGVTERYAHFDPTFMRAAADAMDRYWNRLIGGGDERRDASVGSDTGNERGRATEIGREGPPVGGVH
jgi:integrase